MFEVLFVVGVSVVAVVTALLRPWHKMYMRKFSDAKSIPLLRPTSLHFEYPEEMMAFKKYRVGVGMGKKEEFKVRSGNREEIFEISASSIMKCTLKGDAFVIEPVNSDIQAFLETTNTCWLWDVKPTKSGTQSLLLVVSAQIKIDDQVALKDIPVFERYVTVKVNRMYVAKEFFSKNWQWLIGTAIGTGIIWQVLKTFILNEK
jgi:hypothetical protein